MGLFSKKKTVKLEIPAAPQYMSAEELLGKGTSFGQTELPLAYGARESALADIATPESSMQFFSGFQPTNFEQGITDTYWESMLENAKRTAGQRASMSGIETAFPELFSRAISPTIYDIGTYLGNLGQQRALTSLTSRLNIDPLSQIIEPIYQNYQTQDQMQKDAIYNQALAQAIANYQYEQQKAANKASSISNIGSLAGMVAGGLLAIPTGGLSLAAMPAIMGGASLGGALGGSAAGLFGGSEAPINMQDALSIYKALRPEKKTTIENVFPKQNIQMPEMTQPVFEFPNFPNYSPLQLPNLSLGF